MSKQTVSDATPLATCYDATVSCYDAAGKLLGNTGGAATLGNTVGSNLKRYVQKARSMMRRGYFTGTARITVTLRFVSTYGGDVLETSREFTV